MFDFTKYETHELKQIKEALETLRYFGLSDMLLSVDTELRKRESV